MYHFTRFFPLLSYILFNFKEIQFEVFREFPFTHGIHPQKMYCSCNHLFSSLSLAQVKQDSEKYNYWKEIKLKRILMTPLLFLSPDFRLADFQLTGTKHVVLACCCCCYRHYKSGNMYIIILRFQVTCFNRARVSFRHGLYLIFFTSQMVYTRKT